MKTAEVCRVGKQTGTTNHTSLHRIEAIAHGVQARFEEETGYSKRVTDATINVARALAIPEAEIERWVAHRLTRVAQDTERCREIKILLEKLLQTRPAQQRRISKGNREDSCAVTQGQPSI